MITTLFQLSYADAEVALTNAVFDQHPESHASWTHVRVDPSGWKRIRVLMDNTLAKALDIAAKPKLRNTAKDELEISVTLFAFPLPPDAWLRPGDGGPPDFLKHTDDP